MNNIVYRVENKFGKGMYTGEGSLNRCPSYQPFRFPDETTFDKETHPMPSAKMLMKSEKDGWLFGFESLFSLSKWLFEDSWKEYLEKNGYEICSYLTQSMYKEDSRQCVFDLESAELVGVHKFSELKKVLKV